MSAHRFFPRMLTLAMIAVAVCCQAQTTLVCNIRTFDAPSGSSLRPLVNALGINRYGNIVGQAANAKGYVRFTDGRIQKLPVNITGFPYVHPYKRNASGVTVGFADNSTGTSRGWILSGSTVKVFSVSGYSHVMLSGINRYGTVVGNLVSLSPSVNNGFVYKNGTLTKLPIKVAFRVTGISDTGVIVGDYVNNTNPQPFDDTHGFIFVNGTFQDFSVPWASTTFITDINATGMIVGVTEGPGGNFIYKDGKFYKPQLVLPDGTTVSGSIFGVNGYGQITGNAGTGSDLSPMYGSCQF